MFKIRQR